MYHVIESAFKGLDRAIYLRHLFFGALIATFMMYFSFQTGRPVEVKQILWLTMNTLLYPYARYTYESIVAFILGENALFANASIVLFTKALTMLLCWTLALFIAPFGLAYLSFRNRY
mgnify:CR=1 FL=1